MFKGGRKGLVGLDIGSHAVKAVELRMARNGFELVNLGHLNLQSDTIVDGHIIDLNHVSDVINRIWVEQGFKTSTVATAISGHAVIVKKILLPQMSNEELDEQIQWEAEQHIPFDIKDVHVDYQVLRRRAEASQMDLLLVAAKRDQIEEYAQLARNAKLKPMVCDIDAFTVQNLFEYSRTLPADQTIALINVGASLSSLNIIANGVSAFTREIANGGNGITEEIQKQLNVPHEQAEAYKCGGSASADDPSRAGMVPQQVVQVIEAVSDTIAAEIQRSLDFFMATSGEGEIARIYVTGGSANLAALARAIERRARVSVETWSPVEKLTIEAKEVDPLLLQARAAQLSVALGLSLRKEKEARA